MAAWFVPLLISIGIQIVAYLIMPKPKPPKPPAARDQDSPVAEAGKPVPVIFGTMEVKGVNELWWGDKSLTERDVKV